MLTLSLLVTVTAEMMNRRWSFHLQYSFGRMNRPCSNCCRKCRSSTLRRSGRPSAAQMTRSSAVESLQDSCEPEANIYIHVCCLTSKLYLRVIWLPTCKSLVGPQLQAHLTSILHVPESEVLRWQQMWIVHCLYTRSALTSSCHRPAFLFTPT